MQINIDMYEPVTDKKLKTMKTQTMLWVGENTF